MKKTISLSLLCAVLLYSTTSCSKQNSTLEQISIETKEDFNPSFDANISKIISLKESDNKLSSIDLALLANNVSKKQLNANNISILNNVSTKTNSVDIINVLAEQNVINEKEKEIFIGLSNEISYSKNPSVVVEKYTNILKENGIFEKFEGVLLALSYTSEKYPEIISLNKKNEYFKLASNNKVAKSFLTSCAGASVGLALAFVGLAASGASVVGAGIGAAGFIYASAQWGASCR